MTRRYGAASALAASGSMGPESVFCNGVNDRMNYTALRTCHSDPFWPVFGRKIQSRSSGTLSRVAA